MTREEILAKVEDIFREVLANQSIVLNYETTADDIEEWSSLTHVQLISAMEKELNIKFSLREMMSWQNVGEIVNSIEKKLG